MIRFHSHSTENMKEATDKQRPTRIMLAHPQWDNVLLSSTMLSRMFAVTNVRLSVLHPCSSVVEIFNNRVYRNFHMKFLLFHF